ncbi:hypothetical protein BJ875DRAFT_498260 [Amylocarpus encephaloides]|uniref:Chromo domain-containing protein n=1 Tax=Amylocarpus encephaloides TaxID=45428 RepID=A0A9P8C2I1_9HELO|nr:hypothetical protein BJ875DRAFT_498260 [Amylocarpus encephaloides]
MSVDGPTEKTKNETARRLFTRITATITEKGRQELKGQRRYIYDQRQKLINEELANYHDQGEWYRSYFDRVVRRMVPERDRLARTLPIAAPLRSPEEEGDDERAETSGAARTKRPRLQGKLEDEDYKVPGGQKSAPKGRSKDPLSHTTDTSLSSLSDDILEAVPQAGEDCRSPWTTPLEAATVDLLSDSESWNFDAIADTISSPIESQEDWVLSGPDTPLSYLSSIPIELVDPELRDTLPSSTSSLPATADSVEDAHGSIPTTTPGHIESTVIQPLCDSQGVGGQPVAIDAERGIWEAEALLAKWKQGKTTWYLVKWKGFPHEGNTWEKRKDISPELVKEFEATYQGNHSGVRLLKKRVLRGRVEYLVEWKGRPEGENSWEKEATISRERIMEFEAN